MQKPTVLAVSFRDRGRKRGWVSRVFPEVYYVPPSRASWPGDRTADAYGVDAHTDPTETIAKRPKSRKIDSVLQDTILEYPVSYRYRASHSFPSNLSVSYRAID